MKKRRLKRLYHNNLLLDIHIKGDLKYGAKRSNPNGGISLLARHVEFIHPVSKKLISVDAPLPKDNLWRDIAP